MSEISPAEEFLCILLTIPVVYLDELSIDDLKWISLCLFERVTFCRCLVDSDGTLYHNCKAAKISDIHNPFCKCCQTRIFTYFFGRFLEKLCTEERLPLFSETALSRAKIQDRTYSFSKDGNKFCFKIIRHLYAFRDPDNMKLQEESWEFNFSDLSLSRISSI